MTTTDLDVAREAARYVVDDDTPAVARFTSALLLGELVPALCDELEALRRGQPHTEPS